MTAIVVRRTAADAESFSASNRKMFIATEDRSLFLMVPYAPRNIDYGGRGRITATIDRPGKKPLLSVGGTPLLTMGFDLVFANPDPDVSVQADIDALEALAASPARVIVNFGPGEAGLWRFTNLSYSSVMRHPVDNSITQATATVELTQASDYTPRVGPLSGGFSSSVGSTRTRTYTVKAGDTLGRISKQFYGTTKHWRFLADANKIRDPHRTKKLKAGRKLTIPPLKKPKKRK